jgi:hypothetical protein
MVGFEPVPAEYDHQRPYLVVFEKKTRWLPHRPYQKGRAAPDLKFDDCTQNSSKNASKMTNKAQNDNRAKHFWPHSEI